MMLLWVFWGIGVLCWGAILVTDRRPAWVLASLTALFLLMVLAVAWLAKI